MTALLGRNGVGKTTTLRALLGLVPARGARAARRRRPDRRADAPDRAARASATCPRTARSSPALTVAENLALAVRNGDARYDLVYELFPELRERARAARRHALGRPAADGRRSPARC